MAEVISASVSLPLPRRRSNVSLRRSLRETNTSHSLIGLAHQGAAEIFGIELLQVIDLLAHAHAQDRELEFLGHGHGDTALSRAVELSHDNTVQAQRLVKLERLVQTVLARRGVDHKHDRNRHGTGGHIGGTLTGHIDHLGKLAHELGARVQTAGGIDEHQVAAALIGLVEHVIAHARRIGAAVTLDNRYAGTLPPHIELLDGAGDELDLDAVACGKLSPAFFGSALTNFGVEPFLKEFLRLAPTPRAYTDTLTSEPVDPCRDDFSGFVFKIQANMDKNHRDRIAFVRICSGKFERGMDAFHVQGNRKLKLATGTSMMADDRAIVDEAYAGDIVGLFDPGIFSIGDTVCSGKRHVQYPQIPTFAPEMFARITQVDTLKRKQFVKGMEELAQEGAIQIFRELGAGMESVIVGVVGVLQFEVLERRLKAEYRVEVRRQPLPYTDIRWIQNDPDTIDIPGLSLTRDTLRVEDMRGGKLLLFTSPWNVDWATDHNPDLILSEFGNVAF